MEPMIAYMKGSLSYGANDRPHERQPLKYGGRSARIKGNARILSDRAAPEHYEGSPPAIVPSYRHLLPPDPPVRVDGRLQALLSRADLAHGRLAGSIRDAAQPGSVRPDVCPQGSGAVEPDRGHAEGIRCRTCWPLKRRCSTLNSHAMWRR